MSCRESIHPVAWPLAIQLALRPGPFSRSIQTVVESTNGGSVSSSPSVLTFVWRTDSSSRSIRTPVDAVNGPSVSSSPSGLMFAPGPARPAAMPPFVTLREDVRSRPRRRASASIRGGWGWIVTTAVTGPPPRNYDFKTRVIGGSRLPHSYHASLFNRAREVSKSKTSTESNSS